MWSFLLIWHFHWGHCLSPGGQHDDFVRAHLERTALAVWPLSFDSQLALIMLSTHKINWRMFFTCNHRPHLYICSIFSVTFLSVVFWLVPEKKQKYRNALATIYHIQAIFTPPLLSFWVWWGCFVGCNKKKLLCPFAIDRPVLVLFE